ncbi:RNA polymerase sigma factor [Sphingomonas sp. VNH70]|uniref:RNA polymerase sigma factor n=1 Tax=Sphingomonas silueang TaxID=3156617 RepID=UPI0032B3F6F7
MRYLTRRLSCRHTAEDVAQDVFLAIPRIRPLRPIVNPRGLLFRIASNMAINLRNQDGRRRELRERHAAILWAAVDEVTPERQLLGGEALACVAQAIGGLPERTRQILHWRRIDGLTNREIAGRLGISTTAVEKHMRTAMATLIRAVDPE